MAGMTRASLRNTGLFGSVLILGVSWMVWRMGVEAHQVVDDKTFEKSSLQVELDNVSRRSTALDQLDALTIDERTATRLDILRHLGLEQSDYDFQVNARQTKTIGGTSLHMREVRLQIELPYRSAMGLIDALHETQKIVIRSLDVRKSTKAGDYVVVVVEGTIYGLEKRTQ